MKKRVISLLLALCLILAIVPASVSAAEVVAEGACGENLTWVLDSEGTLTISGEGEMESDPWSPYMEEIKKLVVEEGVTSICTSAFWGILVSGDECEAYQNLYEVVLPDTLQSIGTNAFLTCIGMSEITIPASIEYIGNKALGWWCGEGGVVGKISDFVIKGYLGTAAETYALENEIAFVAIEDETAPTDPEPTNPEPTEPQPIDPEPTEPAPTDPEPTDPEPTTPVSNPFTDVSSSAFYYEPVLWAVGEGITSGVSATSFAPNQTCTRAQVVTFLWRAAGEPEPTSTKNPFSDVRSSAYYYKAVLWAVEQGITTGISSTKFGPDNACTRAQVVTFLWRSEGCPEPTGSNPFSDVKSTSYCYKAVLWAAQTGITTGISATKFAPDQSCTRGQIVTFLYRAKA